jgi:hypothetical protein
MLMTGLTSLGIDQEVLKEREKLKTYTIQRLFCANRRYRCTDSKPID